MTDQNSFNHIAGGRSHFVSAGANRIHYVTVGNGDRALVFVHGWACHLGFWHEQVAALADKARLILIDLPGHGRSDPPETACTMDLFAEAVLAAVRDAGVERATFIGHSMGAAVLCGVYRLAPEKVAALVSVDGLLCRLPGTPAEARALIGAFASAQYPAHAREFIRSLFPVPGTEVLCGRVTLEMLATPQRVMLGGMRAMLDPELPDWALEKVGVPLLVINARTPWWNSAYEKHVRALSPRVDYTFLEGAGHFLMLEQPAIFNLRLGEWLKKQDLIR